MAHLGEHLVYIPSQHHNNQEKCWLWTWRQRTG